MVMKSKREEDESDVDPSAFRYHDVDLLIEGKLVVELKAVSQLAPIHEAQIISYLKMTDCKVGLLINFNVPLLKYGIKRFVHPDLLSK